MSRKTSFIFALLSGVVCACAVYAYTHAVAASAAEARNEALQRYGGEQAQVCVATQDIAPGEVLSSTNSEVRPWLVDLLPDGALSSADEAAGQQVSYPIVKGSVISNKYFAEAGTTLSVPEGTQALSFELPAANALGGALEAKSVIDVYAIGGSGASLLLSNASVLATGSSNSQIWVTLAVPAEQVEEMINATQTTTLYLTLPGQKPQTSEANTENADSDSAKSESANTENAGKEDAKPKGSNTKAASASPAN